MKSMTGYGAATGKVGRGRFYIELKTINHRYCDVSLKMPSRMGALESKIREYVQARLKRGKADLFLKELEPAFGGTELVLNVALAKQYQKALRQLQTSLHLPVRADPLSLMGVGAFIQAKEKEGNYLQYWKGIQKLLTSVLKQVEKMRSKEGAHLLQDQKKRLKTLQRLLQKIQVKSHHNSKKRRSVLINNPVGGPLETNMAVDKMDITEEVIRLTSHAKQYERLLRSQEEKGRKLDFLIQEMHREVNTIGAKANDAEISGWIVDGKALLENLREQVQNIE